jgi:UDP-N-acetylglucosamine 2-epimerase (non-hydrolysing)
MKKKPTVFTILGTRPEIIRLSRIIARLDKKCKHVLIHTGQNYDKKLSDIFFEDLGVRKPDHYLGAKTDSFGSQIAVILTEIEKLFLKSKPDRVLILGDTNSGLTAIISERLGIPVYHMEAGNRCHDWKVPEEINRKLIDSVSTYALPYTPGSRDNLLKEGIPNKRIMVSGNPINEVLTYYNPKVEKSDILKKLKLQKGQYFLVTVHRAENVDNKKNFTEILHGLKLVAKKYKLPVIVSTHPRTKAKLKHLKLKNYPKEIIFSEPFGFFDFVKLEKNAKLVLTDSGTVQEECCIFHVPAVTTRSTTERPETVKCKSNMVSGLNSKRILSCVDKMLARKKNWKLPRGYGDTNVSDKVVNFILGDRKCSRIVEY